MPRFFLLFLLLPVLIYAQPKYPVTDVTILRSGNPIRNAWAGGFNNPVFSTIDINGDSLKDLFVYDKAGWKALVFLNTGSKGHPSFTYAPQYDRLFPPGLRDWAIMRDYNHDGVSDIFALTEKSSSVVLGVYKGYRSGQFLGYDLAYSDLSYTLGMFQQNIFTYADNMPVIMDVDGDGDIDILAPDQAGGITLDYFKNMAVDSGYSPDSLIFSLASQCWGNFTENIYGCSVNLNQMCKKELTAGIEGNAPRHQGGACCGFHYRNDNVVSLLLADITCANTKFLENGGDSTTANIISYDSIFPHYNIPVYVPIAPCAYTVDANNDGYEDLFFAPFAINSIQQGQSQDVNVVQYYKNVGIDSINQFSYVDDTTMTAGVDVGSESHAVFFDYNNDGLIDIVVGNYGQFSQTGYPTSYTALYTNIGTDTLPVYKETSLNWNSLTTYQLNGIYPAFGDLDGDGHPDMLIGDSYGYISFFHNTGIDTAKYPSMTGPDWFGINVGANAAPFIYDVNGDGLNDLVIGSKNNNVLYYWNFGTITTPMFSPDSVNTSFGKIQVYDHSVAGTPPGYATPFITTENGKTVLYSGSQLGRVFKYIVNTDSLRKGNFALVDSDVLGTKPGLRSNVYIADINHDGKNDYLTGNIRGGINLYSDVNWGNIVIISSINDPESDKTQMLVYPNPAKDRIVCRLSLQGTELETVKLYNLMGEMVNVLYSKTNNSITISVNQVPDGMYVVQAIDSKGYVYQNKVSIIK